MIPEFKEFSVTAVRTSFNLIIRALNRLLSIRGDSTFIQVAWSSGLVISLNWNAVLARLPKNNGDSIIPANITGNSSVNHTTWVYQTTLPDNSTANAYNKSEWNGTTSGIIAGSPGSLGVTVATTGTLTGTSCVVKPIGNKPVLLTWSYTNTRWEFDNQNSAGA